MSLGELSPKSDCEAHAYLLDRDTGLLCRILGLYASRGLDVTSLRYCNTAQGIMRLEVGVAVDSPDAMDTMRVLREKASTFVGILAAAELPPELHPTLSHR